VKNSHVFLFFLFTLLAAYMEGCFGSICNLVVEEISRHSFVPFFFIYYIYFEKKSYQTLKILKL